MADESPVPPRGIYVRAALWLTLALRLLGFGAVRHTLEPIRTRRSTGSVARIGVGLHSKPPLIAWAIWATTPSAATPSRGCGFPPRCSTPPRPSWVRVGRQLYDARTGFWAAILYLLMPGVQLSSLVIATDAPLLAFYAAALLAYARFLQAGDWRWAAGLGVALGFAFLAKYAAIYGLVGLALHWALSPDARLRWRWRPAMAAVGGLLLILGPNLAWKRAA